MAVTTNILLAFCTIVCLSIVILIIIVIANPQQIINWFGKNVAQKLINEQRSRINAEIAQKQANIEQKIKNTIEAQKANVRQEIDSKILQTRAEIESRISQQIANTRADINARIAQQRAEFDAKIANLLRQVNQKISEAKDKTIPIQVGKEIRKRKSPKGTPCVTGKTCRSGKCSFFMCK